MAAYFFVTATNLHGCRMMTIPPEVAPRAYLNLSGLTNFIYCNTNGTRSESKTFFPKEP